MELKIDRMTLEEKLSAMEALWDDLCQREEQVPVPQWHKDLLDERERLVQQGKSQFLAWDTAKKSVTSHQSPVIRDRLSANISVICG